MNYYVEDHVNGTLRSNGAGGPPRIDKQPLLVGALAVAENQRGELRESDLAMQLTAGGGKPGQGYSAVREGTSIRRLTPLECERLQALPDGWTEGGLDSKRYAALGDAVTVTVGEWIGRRLLQEAKT